MAPKLVRKGLLAGQTLLQVLCPKSRLLLLHTFVSKSTPRGLILKTRPPVNLLPSCNIYKFKSGGRCKKAANNRSREGCCLLSPFYDNENENRALFWRRLGELHGRMARHRYQHVRPERERATTATHQYNRWWIEGHELH